MEAAKFVVDLNLRRRHLNASQRAIAADRLADIRRGGFHGNQWVRKFAQGKSHRLSSSAAATAASNALAQAFRQERFAGAASGRG